MLPPEAGLRPLALGVFHARKGSRDAEALVETLKHGISQLFAAGEAEAAGAPSRFVRAV